LERGEVTPRRTGLVAGDVHVEALALRLEAFTAQVPFADVCGGVSRRLERLGEGRLFERQLRGDDGAQQWLVGPVGAAGDEVGEVEALRVLAGDQRGARRRADGAGGVGGGELYAVGGEAVEVRRAVVGAAVTAEVAGAEVVDQDDDDVGTV